MTNMSVILIHNFQFKKRGSSNQLPSLLELGFTKALAAFSSHAICGQNKKRKPGGHRDGVGVLRVLGWQFFTHQIIYLSTQWLPSRQVEQVRRSLLRFFCSLNSPLSWRGSTHSNGLEWIVDMD